jgi:hypothetical protein
MYKPFAKYANLATFTKSFMVQLHPGENRGKSFNDFRRLTKSLQMEIWPGELLKLSSNGHSLVQIDSERKNRKSTPKTNADFANRSE